MPDLSRPTILTGLIGHGIAASLSPAMHEAEAAAQGRRLAYQRIDLAQLGLGPDALPELLLAAERMGFSGLNITHPCKQAVLPLLHDLSSEAAALGAVNTVLLRDGRRLGHNTDWSGFAAGFRRGLPEAPRQRVLQIGVGGAGAAVAHALLVLGVEALSLFDVDAARAATQAAALNARFGAGRVQALAALPARLEMDGLVNCTPIGMAAHPGLPLDPALLHPRMWVAEVIYFPLETALLRAARALGCRTLDGGGMAVHQAVDAFRLFTGQEPDAARMRAHFARLVAG